ncbi:hypothetical protein [Paractinoplanes toevensis]|uniref:Uncharacterized protein n=1 Tax=Paractinoplanes toevensis TaxID=571911 RepID=A0A919T6V1_9ACTN|nr:hypothetical protein [Actinoplanes toevensis]GIM88829.1 hypothetical protein Ato02nite_006220 [Actinoplanes toevensis]
MSMDRERLNLATDYLRDRGVAVVVGLHGSTGVGEDDLNAYKRAAATAGTDRWVGTHVGAVEHHGADWDQSGVLRYRHDNSPVREIWWSFNHRQPDLADLLVAALQAAGLNAEGPNDDHTAVLLRLDGAR